jgi:hypothetical protein
MHLSLQCRKYTRSKSHNLQDSFYLENIPRKSKEVGREEEAGVLWISVFPPCSQCVPQMFPIASHFITYFLPKVELS